MAPAPRDLSASGTLYSALGVTSDASPLELRRSYRQLARALHPDSQHIRAGSPSRQTAAEAELSLVTQAYEILSDERRRDVYDAVGLDGLRLHEWIQTIQPTKAPASAPPALPPVLVYFVLAVGGGVLCTLLAAFVLLATMRYDQDDLAPSALTLLPWPLVFAPLWLADTLVVLVGGCLLLLPHRLPSTSFASSSLLPLSWEAWRSSPATILALRIATPIAFVVTWQLLLCSRLSLPPSEAPSWLAVFTPLLVWRGVAIAALPGELRASQRAVAGPDGTAWHKRADAAAPFGRIRALVALAAPLRAAARQLGANLLLTLQLSLFPPRLEGLLMCRWRVLLAPTWIWLAIEVALAARALWRPPSDAHGGDLGGRSRGDEEHTPMGRARRAWRQTTRLLWLSGYILGGLALWWTAAAFDSAEAGRAPAMQVMAPVVLALATAVGCIVCTCGTAGPPRRAAVRAWAREWARWTQSMHDGGAPPAPPFGLERDGGDGAEEVDSRSSSDGVGAPAVGAGLCYVGALALEPEDGDPDPNEVMRAAYSEVITPLPGRMPTPPHPAAEDVEHVGGAAWEEAFDDVLPLDLEGESTQEVAADAPM